MTSWPFLECHLQDKLCTFTTAETLGIAKSSVCYNNGLEWALQPVGSSSLQRLSCSALLTDLTAWICPRKPERGVGSESARRFPGNSLTPLGLKQQCCWVNSSQTACMSQFMSFLPEHSHWRSRELMKRHSAGLGVGFPPVEKTTSLSTKMKRHQV